MALNRDVSDAKNDNGLTAMAFEEKLASLCVVHYKDKDVYYQEAKRLFQISHIHWPIKDTGKALKEVFHHAKMAYQRQMLMDLDRRYFTFIDGLKLFPEEMLSSFEYLCNILFEIKGDYYDFLFAALKDPQTEEVANAELQVVLLGRERKNVVSALLKEDSQVISQLTEKNFNALIKPLYSDLDYAGLIKTLYELQNYSAMLKMGEDRPFLMLDDYVKTMDNYFLEKREEQNRKILYYLVMHRKKDFKSVYDFFVLLNQKEKEEYYREMYTVAYQRRCEFGFGFLYDYPGGTSPTRLRQFNVVEFMVLHDELINVYPDQYLDALILMLNKKNKAYQQFPDYYYFDCLDRYDSDFEEIIDVPIFKTLSFTDITLRYRYIKALKKHNMIQYAGIQEYRG